jgi:anti-anti-sigma regulatory factor
LLIWRVGGDLFFASVGHLHEGLKAALAASRPPAKHVLLDADSVNLIDTSACDAVLNFIKELRSQGITFAFARVRDEVRERMRSGGIEAAVGLANFHERVTNGVCAWQQQKSLEVVAGRPQPASSISNEDGAAAQPGSGLEGELYPTIGSFCGCNSRGEMAAAAQRLVEISILRKR